MESAVKVNITKDGTNKLNLHIDVDRNTSTYTSPAYLSGVNYFQIKLNIENLQGRVLNNIYVRNKKISKKDDLLYICKVTSNALRIKEFSFTGENWNIFYCYDKQASKESSTAFDLSVITDVAPRVNQFADLYEDTQLTDFKLHCQHGTVNIHKAVLACASPFFRKMLSGKWKETNEGHVEIPVARIEVLENLKKYIYLQILPEEDLESLIEVGSCYMMPELLQRCNVKLIHKLSEDNVLEMITFALKFDLTNLLLYILKYIKSDDTLKIDNIPALRTSSNEDCTD